MLRVTLASLLATLLAVTTGAATAVQRLRHGDGRGPEKFGAPADQSAG